jgi:FO synthase subunit 2
MHLAKLREIQKLTGGFTEFVPLNFIASEAPMYKHNLHDGIRNGSSSNDVLLTHAIARIMLNNFIDNIQMSWVKEGQKMSQLLLMWGANDFGGTLINESISTSAGAQNGQLIKPKTIRRLVREVGRIPAERNTTYRILKKFENEPESTNALDDLEDEKMFGSYFDLVKINKFKYQNPRRS